MPTKFMDINIKEQPLSFISHFGVSSSISKGISTCIIESDEEGSGIHKGRMTTSLVSVLHRQRGEE